MAIKILRTGLPVIGYAKIGMASEKDSPLKGSPMRWDHIELTGIERDEHGRLLPNIPLMRELVARGAKTCGGCPRSNALGFPKGLPTQLGIYLAYNDLELNFPSRLAWFKGRTAFCTGDGEKAMRRKVIRTERAGDRNVDVFGEEAPHPGCGWSCPDLLARRCKPHGKLRFILSIQENVGGCFEFRTTSLNSIPNITEGLEMIRAATGGVLQWIPLLFEVAPQTVQPREGGRASVAYIARVTFPGSPQKLLEQVHAHLQVRAPMVAQIRKLEASLKDTTWSETPEEIADIVSEFYQAAPAEDVSQERFDPVTGEVFEDVPTIDRSGEATGEPAVEPSASGQATACEEGTGDPFGATAGELAAEAARKGEADLGLGAAQTKHLSDALVMSGVTTQAKRITFVRRVTRRNVNDLGELTAEEYAQVCLELGVRPVGSGPLEQLGLGTSA